jgi:hypothetical protein
MAGLLQLNAIYRHDVYDRSYTDEAPVSRLVVSRSKVDFWELWVVQLVTVHYLHSIMQSGPIKGQCEQRASDATPKILI